MALTVAIRPLVLAIGQTDEVHGIGDEDEAVGVGIEGNLDGSGVQVLAIGDDAEVRARQALGLAEHAKDARVAVVQRPHGVEEVRDHGGPGRDGLGRVLVRGLGVADREDDVPARDLGDQLRHLAPLRRRRDHLDGDRAVRVRLRAEVGGAVGVLQVRERLRHPQHVHVVAPVLGRAEEGALAVRAERLGPVLRHLQVPRGPEVRQGRLVDLAALAGEGRHVRGDARLDQPPVDLFHLLGVGGRLEEGGEVEPEGAVQLALYEARR